MRNQVVVGVLLVVAFGGPAAKADMLDQTTYTINFTGTTPLPTGSFTYDPDTKLFSNFLVTWNGTQFDLTSSANSLVFPPVYLTCLDSSTPITATFDFMKGSCNPPPDGYRIYWAAIAEPPAQQGFPVPGWKTFDFVLTNDSGYYLYLQASADYSDSSYVTASGQWTTAESSTVPEPSSLVLVTTALLGIVCAKKRIVPGLPTKV